MANTIVFTVGSNNLAYNIVADINNPSAGIPVVVSSTPPVFALSIEKNLDRLKIVSNGVIIAEILSSQVSSIATFNGVSKTYTTLSQLKTDFDAVIDTVVQAGGGGSYTAGENLKLTATVFSKDDYLEADAGAPPILKLGKAYGFVNVGGLGNDAIFYSKHGVYAPGTTNVFIPTDGTLYYDFTGSGINDPLNWFIAQWNIADNTLSWVKNANLEIHSTTVTLLQAIKATGAQSNFKGFIAPGLTITINPGALGMNAYIYGNYSIGAGVMLTGLVGMDRIAGVDEPDPAVIAFSANKTIGIRTQSYRIYGDGAGEENFSVIGGDVRFGYITSSSYWLTTETQVHYYAQGEQESMLTIDRDAMEVSIGIRQISGDPTTFGKILKIDPNAATLGDVDDRTDSTKIIVDYKDQLINVAPNVGGGGKVQIDGTDTADGNFTSLDGKAIVFIQGYETSIS